MGSSGALAAGSQALPDDMVGYGWRRLDLDQQDYDPR